MFTIRLSDFLIGGIQYSERPGPTPISMGDLSGKFLAIGAARSCIVRQGGMAVPDLWVNESIGYDFIR